MDREIYTSIVNKVNGDIYKEIKNGGLNTNDEDISLISAEFGRRGEYLLTKYLSEYDLEDLKVRDIEDYNFYDFKYENKYIDVKSFKLYRQNSINFKISRYKIEQRVKQCKDLNIDLYDYKYLLFVWGGYKNSKGFILNRKELNLKDIYEQIFKKDSTSYSLKIDIEDSKGYNFYKGKEPIVLTYLNILLNKKTKGSGLKIKQYSEIMKVSVALNKYSLDKKSNLKRRNNY